MFVTTRPYITRGYFTINMLHLSAQISTECKHHNFTALLPDKARRATLPWLHLYPNHPTLRSCISGDCNISLEHTKLERSDLELHLRIRSTCFFGPWPHLPRTRLPSHSCKSQDRGVVTMHRKHRCNSHQHHYKMRFHKTKRFNLSLCQKPKLTISLP